MNDTSNPQTQAQPNTTVHVHTIQSPQNGVGLAGFILSLVGLLSCGLLSPIGLILSFVGMFKNPKGFAITGLILGILGSLWIVVVVVFIGVAGVMAAAGIAAASQHMPTIATEISMSMVSNEIDSYHRQHNALPDDTAGAALLQQPGTRKDHWGNSFDYRRLASDRFELISAGPDGNFGTPDDITETFEMDASGESEPVRATPPASSSSAGSGTSP